MHMISRMSQQLLGVQRVDRRHSKAPRPRICRVEQIEPREMLAADLHLGSVYYEQHAGDDSDPNILQFTFEGGAPGTTLNQIIIDGDKDGKGMSSGDVFFDTAPGGLGSFGSNPLKIVSHDGFQVLNTQVVDGGMRMVINLSGFEVGEKLVLSVDVDEAQFVDDIGDIDTNAVVEGGEFQRSHFIASFTAPHYEDIQTSVIYWDDFDSNFAAADAETKTHLDLPPDKYVPNDDLADYTAGAVAQAKQVPLPNSLSGVVYADMNQNNHQDPGDNGLSGVTVSLQEWNGTQYSTIKTTTTDAQGAYKFDKLEIGKYRVVETQPSGYLSVGDTPGKVNGQTRGVIETVDILTEINLDGGEDSLRNDFAEVLPASISGYVYSDLNNNGHKDANEPGIGGVTVALRDASNQPTGATVMTDANGFYIFTGLRPATYGVSEVQPVGWLDGLDSAGDAGGAAHNPGDLITGAVLTPGLAAKNYDFGELKPVGISGYVRIDMDGDGDCSDDPNAPPLEGVTIHLLDSTGKIIATTQTDANGFYQFDGFNPGTYGVSEVQPVGYFDGDTKVGSVGGVAGDDIITGVILSSGVHGVEYDFCEIPPAELCGYVYVDSNNNGIKEAGEAGIAGVTVQLRDASGHLTGQTAITDASGLYCFLNLHPGTYGVSELQPPGYLDGIDTPGTAGGTAHNPGDLIDDIMLMPMVHSENNNFGELLPVGISGYVKIDATGDCENNPNAPPLAGVTIDLLDSTGKVIGTTTTDANGYYEFKNMTPGTYGVHEHQPTGYFDGDTHVGTEGGEMGDDIITQVTLKSGAIGLHYDFCEVPPSSIAGQVHARHGEDCDVEDGATPLQGVVIHLIDSHGDLVATTTTDVNGNYKFTDLRQDIYRIVEEQPDGYFEGDADVGSEGGTAETGSLITDIMLMAGIDAVNYDFCEIPPASLAGYVFQDGPPITVAHAGDMPDILSVRDGKLTPDDTLLPGVVLMLRDGVTGQPIMGSVALPGYYNPNQPIMTVTDAHGHYQFDGLPPGSYGVFDVKPAGYIPAIDTPGTLGGVVISGLVITDPAILAAITAPPTDDAIVGINLLADYHSEMNNFSVVVTTVPPETPIIIPPLQLPPPPLPPALGFTPIIEVIAPPVVQPPLLVLPIITRAGGQLYTWHLSVVDAGLPRGPEETAGEVQLTSLGSDDEVGWTDDDLDVGEWFLGNAPDATGKVTTRHVKFGIKKGRPVAGDFNGDGKTDIGVFLDGRWFIDLNDNGQWDAGDLWAKLGHKGDRPVTGDWDGDGKTDIGIYGPAWSGDPRAVAHEPGLPDPHNPNSGKPKNIPRPHNETAVGKRTLKLTAEGKPRADLIDHVFFYGTPGDHPVVGDWNGDGIHTIAVFRDGRWHRDFDGDGKWSKADTKGSFGQPGDLPVVGDFNGDGVDELGVFRDGVWFIDTNANGQIDPEDQTFQLGAPGDVPVVGDWDGDGTSNPGVYRDTTSSGAVELPPAA